MDTQKYSKFYPKLAKVKLAIENFPEIGIKIKFANATITALPLLTFVEKQSYTLLSPPKHQKHAIFKTFSCNIDLLDQVNEDNIKENGINFFFKFFQNILPQQRVSLILIKTIKKGRL